MERVNYLLDVYRKMNTNMILIAAVILLGCSNAPNGLNAMPDSIHLHSVNIDKSQSNFPWWDEIKYPVEIHIDTKLHILKYELSYETKCKSENYKEHNSFFEFSSCLTNKSRSSDPVIFKLFLSENRESGVLHVWKEKRLFSVQMKH